MPSERSEWAQPDVAILLTIISYYHIGENGMSPLPLIAYQI